MRDHQPQYQLDIDRLAGEPQEDWQDYDHADGGSPLGLHDTTLYDMDESRLGGSLVDEATGLPHNNSTSLGLDNLVEVSIDHVGPEYQDVLPKLEVQDDDETARWLADRPEPLLNEAADGDISLEAA